jgi:transcriptional regulator with XRE-family HTH domain
MQLIVNILNTTGISQEKLASYIGLSRQALMKAAKHFMSLDTATLIKLSRLQQCIDSASHSEKRSVFSTSIPEHAAEREKICRYRALILQRKLDACEQVQKKYTLFLHALELLQPEDEEEILRIQKIKANIIKDLDKCGVATCMRLRKKIYLLEAEADYISRFVNEQNSWL